MLIYCFDSGGSVRTEEFALMLVWSRGCFSSGWIWSSKTLMWQGHAWSSERFFREAGITGKWEAEGWFTSSAWHYGNSWVIPFHRHLFIPLSGKMSHRESHYNMIFELLSFIFKWAGWCILWITCPVHILSALDALRDHWIFILKQYEIPLNLLFSSVIMIF